MELGKNSLKEMQQEENKKINKKQEGRRNIRCKRREEATFQLKLEMFYSQRKNREMKDEETDRNQP